MSDENESLIEKTFVTELGAKYPFVKAKGVNEQYGIQFFPSVFCIDANGVVFSVPDDRMPSEAQIEELLQSVSLAPKLPEDSRYDPLRSLWEKHDYDKLRDYLDKLLAQPNLDEEMRGVYDGQRKELQKRADAQVAKVERLGGGPDYFAAEEQLEKLKKTWKGFPAADAAEAQLKRFGSDSAIKKEIAAGKALQKALRSFDPGKSSSQAKKLVAELEKIAKKYEGTHAAKQADEHRQRLSKS